MQGGLEGQRPSKKELTMKKITIYDTTLRDGAQSEDVNLTLEDKIKIALKLDEFGVSYIEGGWPGSSPLDTAFFKEIANYGLKNSVIAAFGSTHHPSSTPESDSNLKNIIASGAKACTIFGKSWDLHVTEALRVSLDRGLEIISDSVNHLKKHVKEVFFDAEHFFDGYKNNKDYALAAIKAAYDAGADAIALCDTNGGTLPDEIQNITKEIVKFLPKAQIGIHTHNDCGCAVAGSLMAVFAGATQVQGTINGVGERCGNANLCSIIPALELKRAGYRCLPKGNIEMLRAVSNYVSEVANMSPFSRQPFVGRSAFAHKGGVHVSAVNRNSALYEHIDPALVGNNQRLLLSDLAGRSNIVALARRFGFHLDKDQPVVKGLLAELKAKANLGYDYAAAEASVELLLLRKLGRRGVREFFKLVQFKALEWKSDPETPPMSEATVTIEVEGVTEHTAAFGLGPVNAMDGALRKALSGFYPRLSEMRLVDFKVRVLTASKNHQGTASQVRVLIESADHDSKWVTVGVSYNIIEASWQALVDSITYKLYKDENNLMPLGQS